MANEQDGELTVLGIPFRRCGSEPARYIGPGLNLYRYADRGNKWGARWVVEIPDSHLDMDTGWSNPEQAIRSARVSVAKMHEGLQKAEPKLLEAARVKPRSELEILRELEMRLRVGGAVAHRNAADLLSELDDARKRERLFTVRVDATDGGE